MPEPAPVLLAILDGWGIGEAGPTNAVFAARTPHIDQLRRDYPSTALTAHNGMVGLPEGQMGNSEVGHLNIGAGRIVYQDFTRINKAISDGDFASNPVLLKIMDAVKEADSCLHCCGLLSDGGVHSHIRHLEALLQMAASKKIRIRIHCFMDGRDTAPDSGIGFMRDLCAMLRPNPLAAVASVCGRYWAMDRDKRWDRVQKAWDALVCGQGPSARDAVRLVQDAYDRGETDEFITPTVMVDSNGQPVGTISDGDAVLMFNFRADRVRQLCHAFDDMDFQGFPRFCRPSLLQLATMTEYEAQFTFPVAFPPVTLDHILGEELSRHGLRQLRIAETEKYAHVTYFFNGGKETPFPNEDRILIDSPRDVPTYDKKPQMSAPQVTDALLAALAKAESEKNPYRLVILNFANGDMVGHSGVLSAAITACETVDGCVARIWDFVRQRGGVMLLTADHGNAEMMVDPLTGGPHTAHTTNPVDFTVVAEAWKGRKLRSGGALKDIAPTILGLLNLPVPPEMEGENLLA